MDSHLIKFTVSASRAKCGLCDVISKIVPESWIVALVKEGIARLEIVISASAFPDVVMLFGVQR